MRNIIDHYAAQTLSRARSRHRLGRLQAAVLQGRRADLRQLHPALRARPRRGSGDVRAQPPQAAGEAQPRAAAISRNACAAPSARPQAATTCGAGSLAFDGRAGSLSISTSEKPTTRSWSHITLRASCAIEASGTTTARAFAGQEFRGQVGCRAGIEQHVLVDPQHRVDRKRQPRRLQQRTVEAGPAGIDEMQARELVAGDDLRERGRRPASIRQAPAHSKSTETAATVGDEPARSTTTTRALRASSRASVSVVSVMLSPGAVPITVILWAPCPASRKVSASCSISLERGGHDRRRRLIRNLRALDSTALSAFGSRAGATEAASEATARGAVMRSNSPVTIRPVESSSVARVAISTIGSFFG